MSKFIPYYVIEISDNNYYETRFEDYADALVVAKKYKNSKIWYLGNQVSKYKYREDY